MEGDSRIGEEAQSLRDDRGSGGASPAVRPVAPAPSGPGHQPSGT